MSRRTVETPETKVSTNTLVWFLTNLWLSAEKSRVSGGELLLLTDGSPHAIEALGQTGRQMVSKEEIRKFAREVKSEKPDFLNSNLLGIDYIPGDNGAKQSLVDRSVLGKGVNANMFRVDGRLTVKPAYQLKQPVIAVDIYQVISLPYIEYKRVVLGGGGGFKGDPLLFQMTDYKCEGLPWINQLLALPVASIVKALSRSDDLVQYLRLRVESPNVPQQVSRKLVGSEEWKILVESVNLMALSLDWYLRFIYQQFANADEEVQRYLVALTEFLVKGATGGFLKGISGDGKIMQYSDRGDGLTSWMGDFLADQQLSAR